MVHNGTPEKKAISIALKSIIFLSDSGETTATSMIIIIIFCTAVYSILATIIWALCRDPPTLKPSGKSIVPSINIAFQADDKIQTSIVN